MRLLYDFCGKVLGALRGRRPLSRRDKRGEFRTMLYAPFTKRVTDMHNFMKCIIFTQIIIGTRRKREYCQNDRIHIEGHRQMEIEL